MYQYPFTRLHVFAKSPVLTTVKTRLQPDFPPEFSLNIHSALVNYCLELWQGAAVCPIQLWLAGEKAPFAEKLPQWQALPVFSQTGADLGERLLHSVRSSFEDNDTQAVILVGTDCPFINEEYLKAACEALITYDVVIGPADDGGYVLLGIKKPTPILFDHIEWGSERVYAQTLAAIEQSNLSYYVLPVLSDIDRPEDIQKLSLLKAFDCFLKGH